MSKKIKWIRQQEKKDCGVACMAMIANHHGYEAPLIHFYKMVGNSSEGVSMKTMIDGFHKIGMIGEGV